MMVPRAPIDDTNTAEHAARRENHRQVSASSVASAVDVVESIARLVVILGTGHLDLRHLDRVI